MNGEPCFGSGKDLRNIIHRRNMVSDPKKDFNHVNSQLRAIINAAMKVFGMESIDVLPAMI